MSQVEQTRKRHPISRPGENEVGAIRFSLLHAVAQRAAEAFEEGYYLEAITLVESLLGTRLESRLTWVRDRQGNTSAVKFSTLGALCKELLSEGAKAAPDWETFFAPISDVQAWTTKRNEALHEMAKLSEGDDGIFDKKYKHSRDVALDGFRLLLAYDAVDRKVRSAINEYTATDDMNGGTAFDILKSLL